MCNSLSVVEAAPAPRARDKGKLQTVAQFYGAMPTGVTVSQKGRVFVNFPRWGDEVPFSVAEIVDGKAVAFPPEPVERVKRKRLFRSGNVIRITETVYRRLRTPNWNDFGASGTRKLLALEKSPRAENLRRNHFVCVQSVVVDPADRLWVLDSGAIDFGLTAPGGPKMVCFDLKTNRAVKTIVFAGNVIKPGTYLNDVRFDLRKGRAGTAYITDSGVGGIIVVDLASGSAFRRLDNHRSVQSEPKFVPLIEGRSVFSTPKNQFPGYVGVKSDGIALSADGSRLFYSPLSSRRLYSVSTSVLLNGKASNGVVENSIVDHGDKGMSDGLEVDAQGRIYCTQLETNSISRRLPSGLFETIVHNDRLLWPDTLSLASNGDLYVITNQLHRQKGFNSGKDLRVKPYSLFKIATDGTPVRLK